MIEMTHPVAKDQCIIRVPETRDDLDAFASWARGHQRDILAVDTETMHTHTYATDFGVRAVQFGSGTEAWVIVVEWSDSHRRAAEQVLRDPTHRFVMHNSPFDVLALHVTGFADLNSLLDRCFDTYILAHLLDSRAAGEDGSPGLGLKALAEVYVDQNATDGKAELMALFRQLKRTKSTGWSHPDLTKYEVYLRYAGLDVIYTYRLLKAIGPVVRGLGLTELGKTEHKVRAITTRMTNRGVLIDVDYVVKLRQRLADEHEYHKAEAKKYGVDNVNSPKQVAAALKAMGVELTARTATGNHSVGKDVILPLAGMTGYWAPIDGFDQSKANPLAVAVANAKRAEKWGNAYAQAFLDLRDKNDRLHASINSLAARTARMAISEPPLQQIPKGWEIRRAFVADDGYGLISADFAQVELRVIAALAQVRFMMDAIRDGTDLHDRTADLIWGKGNWTKLQRAIGKNVAFLFIYGGGATRLAATASIPLAEAKKIYEDYKRVYPELPKYSARLQRQAAQNNWAVITPYGRRLPLSRERSYAAVNYAVQSTARDLFTDALQRLSNDGLDDSLLLPVHDEIITQFPLEVLDEMAPRIKNLMTSTFHGLPIDSDAEILYGSSWGSHPDFKIPAAEDYRPWEHK